MTLHRALPPCAAALAVLAAALPARAANVTFTGTVANLCVLTLSTPGTLGMSAGGTTLSSDDLGAGGINAVLAVSATGTNPTIEFGAPTLTGPAASTGNAAKQISYVSASGTTQPYTSGSSTLTMTRLLDTVTVKGRATNPDGFVSGVYNIASTVTCQQ